MHKILLPRISTSLFSFFFIFRQRKILNEIYVVTFPQHTAISCLSNNYINFHSSLDIKKPFAVSPSPAAVEAGSAASLRCTPPAAAPAPRVSWLKHGQPLQQDHNVLISAEGNLLISRATLQVSNL